MPADSNSSQCGDSHLSRCASCPCASLSKILPNFLFYSWTQMDWAGCACLSRTLSHPRRAAILACLDFDPRADRRLRRSGRPGISSRSSVPAARFHRGRLLRDVPFEFSFNPSGLRRPGSRGRAASCECFSVGLEVSVTVAYLSYRYFESPFLALKKKRFSPMDNSKSQPAAPAVVPAPQVIPAQPAAS
jgi:hypothetical protein